MSQDDAVVTIGREALYERVWQTPMRKLAAEMGMSDVGLAKVCRRMSIPVPGRGHWAKTAAGARVKRPPLKPLLPTDTITQRQMVVDLRAGESVQAERDGPLGKHVAFEADASNRIVVKDHLRRPHRLVAASSKALAVIPTKQGEYISTWRTDALDIQVTKALLPRALRILDALIQAFDSRGWPVLVGVGDDRKSIVRVFDQEIPFGIREPLKKVRNAPATPVRFGRGEVCTPYQSEFRDEPAGRLALVIRNTWGYGVHRSFDERTGLPLEDRLNAFVLAVAAEGFREALAARARMECEVERLQAAERYQAEERRKEVIKARVSDLCRDAASWRAAKDLRDYRDAVLARANEALPLGASDPEIAIWLVWVDEVIANTDPLARAIPAWGGVGGAGGRPFENGSTGSTVE